MNNNRIQNKKAASQFKTKEKPIKAHPKILKKSKQLVGARPVDIVEVLLDPEAKKDKERKIERLKDELKAKELTEVTHRPVTNFSKRYSKKREVSNSPQKGDHLVKMFRQGAYKRREDKASKDYWDERQAKEC